MTQEALLEPKISDILLDSFKKMESVQGFKKAIKTWKPAKCPCRLCKFFVQNIAFFDEQS